MWSRRGVCSFERFERAKNRLGYSFGYAFGYSFRALEKRNVSIAYSFGYSFFHFIFAIDVWKDGFESVFLAAFLIL